MAKKKAASQIKLQVKAGEANPAPPIGPALGQHGVNIMDFCKAFNAQTQNIEKGLPLPVIIDVYPDRSFSSTGAAPAAGTAPATATGAAAETPNFSSIALTNSTTSITLISAMASKI